MFKQSVEKLWQLKSWWEVELPAKSRKGKNGETNMKTYIECVRDPFGPQKCMNMSQRGQEL